MSVMGRGSNGARSALLAAFLLLIAYLAAHFLAGNVLFQPAPAANLQALSESSQQDELALSVGLPARHVEGHHWGIIPAALPLPVVVSFPVFQPPKI